jgi:glutathione S-transferase
MEPARLYGFELSHPMQMARMMLEEKGIGYRLVNLPVGLHPVAVRMFGFRGGTVPALRLPDGRRVQTTRAIARALDQLVPEPRLVGDAPGWSEAETWADEVLQNVTRILMRRLAVDSLEIRRWIADVNHMPLPGAMSRTSGPVARLLAAKSGATEEHIRATLAALPSTMDRVDALLTDGTARTDPPDALALQLIASTKSISGFADLRPILAGRPSTALADALDVPLPPDVPVRLPAAWLEQLNTS